ncbi:MAG TPA: Mu transposase C-terminal domain-containing protein [Terracidiphilus sp.]
MRISVGGRVLVASGEAVITHVVSTNQVIVRELATGAVHPLPVRNLKPAPVSAVASHGADLSLISQENWAAAQMRYEAIQPLLEAPRMDAHVLQEVARKTGRHQATIYRWLKRYRQEAQQTALIPAKRGVEPGHNRLKPEIDAIIQAAIQERYLTRNRVKATPLHRDVALKCRSAGLPVPHVNTLRNRISRVAPRTLAEGRYGKRAAREQFEPILGHFPSADCPLAVVQIDHTKLDLIVVDEVDRKPLARPWFTVAIDVCSRVVPGFYLSLEAPGAASTGMCVACAILPKDHLLAKWGITTPWPVWGKMAAIHCDNGKDFRGAMLGRACQQYGIELLFRPVRQPHYGGHIERLMGTFAQEIHTLPGTTFAKPEERKGYDSEKRSALTIRELELWIARYIVEIYHQKPHSRLAGRTPIRVYEEGIAKAGLPEICTTEEQLRLDFMPLEQRSITVNGVVVDNISYFHDVLRPWINSKEKDGRRRQFVVRRDPRDISVVHFFDPELNQYFAIPYRDTSHPAISVWELREIQRRLRQEGRDSTNAEVIFHAYEQMRNIEDTAVNKTQEMRRNIERRNSRQPPSAPGAPSGGSADGSWWEEEIRPFSEVVTPK